MTALDTSLATIRDFPTRTVETRSSWFGTWTTQTYLYVDSCSKAMAPQMSQAQLSYEYGRIIRPGLSTHATYLPLGLLYNFVRITWTAEGSATATTWYGVIVSFDDDSRGYTTIDGTRVLSGDQNFTCLGMEWLLSRQQMVGSLLEDGTVINRAIPFNDGSGGNRSRTYDRANKGALVQTNVYGFSQTLDTATEWTAEDILNYVAYAFALYGATGLDVINVDVLNSSLLSWYKPSMIYHGETKWDFLNQLIDRRRGVAWSVDVNSVDRLEIRIHSLARNDVIVDTEAGISLSANANKVTLEFDDKVDVRSARITKNVLDTYDRVFVMGARRTSTFTVSDDDSNLDEDWEGAQETLYRLGLGALGGVDMDEQERRQDSLKMSDEFSRIYTHYLVPANWDEKSSDGSGGSAFAFVNPYIDPVTKLIDATQKEPMWVAGLRFLDYLPLKEIADYTRIASGVTDKIPSGSRPQWRRPFAIILILNDGTDRYEFVDKIADVYGKNEQVGQGGLKFSCSVRMQDGTLGVVIRPDTLAHVIAINDYIPSRQSSEESQLDFHTIRCTCAIETDEYVQEWWPITQGLGSDVSRDLSISLGDDYRLDYVAPRTVVGLSDGVPQVSDGGFVRDDRAQMRRIARLAYEWYKDTRASLNVIYRQISDQFAPGQMITQIGSGATAETITTVVTAVKWNFQPAGGTTTIDSDYAELDIRVVSRDLL